MTLTINDGEWEAIGDHGDARHRLLLKNGMVINGVPFHVEAWAVHEEDGVQEADVYRGDFNNIYEAVGGDGPFMTMSIKGREYAVFISPHCA